MKNFSTFCFLLFALSASAFESVMTDTNGVVRGRTNIVTPGSLGTSNQFGQVIARNGGINASNISGMNLTSTNFTSTNATILNLGASNINLGNGKFIMNGSTGLLNSVSLSNATLISGNVSKLTNGAYVTPTLYNPSLVNGVNSGLAFSSPGSAEGTEQFGDQAQATADSAHAFGKHAFATAEEALAIGNFSAASGLHSIAIGTQTEAQQPYSVAIGTGAVSSQSNSTAIGGFATTTRPNQVRFGSGGVEVEIGGGLTVLGGITNINVGRGTNTFGPESDLAFRTKSVTSLGNGVNVDLPVGTNVFIKISGNTAAATISGLDAAGAQRDGALRVLEYDSVYPLTYSYENVVDPVAANRIDTVSKQDVVSTGPCVAWFRYVDSRWKMISYWSLVSNVTNLYSTNIISSPSVLASTGNQTNYTIQFLPGSDPNPHTIYTANTNVFFTLAGTNQANWGRGVWLNARTSTAPCNIAFNMQNILTNYYFTNVVSAGTLKYVFFNNLDTSGSNVTVGDSSLYRR